MTPPSDPVASDAADGRGETALERLDRNWSDLLQELRVTQTGVQLLTGFLLTIAFQPRFATLDAHQRIVYLVVVALASAATILLVAPVLAHRLLFRRGRRGDMVRFAHRCAMAGATLLGVALCGVVFLIFDVVEGVAAATVACAVAAVGTLGLWFAAPWRMGARGGPPDDGDPADGSAAAARPTSAGRAPSS